MLAISASPLGGAGGQSSREGGRTREPFTRVGVGGRARAQPVNEIIRRDGGERHSAFGNTASYDVR